MTKQKTSVAITPEGRDYLVRLAEKLGISQSAVIEIAIRAHAKQHEIPAKEATA